MNERIRLREKSAMVEAEVKNLEEGIKKDFLDRKIEVIKQDELDYIDRLGDHRRKFLSLLHGMGPYVIKEITEGGTVQLEKLNSELFTGQVNGSQLKSYIGGPAS